MWKFGELSLFPAKTWFDFIALKIVKIFLLTLTLNLCEISGKGNWYMCFFLRSC